MTEHPTRPADQDSETSPVGGPTCGRCKHLGPPIPTQDMKTRPVGYCAVLMTWRLQGEPGCARFKALDDL